MADEKMRTCGDCIYADLCEQLPHLREFNRDNLAYCRGFKNKADYAEVVRCNKCTYWDKATVNKKGFLICPASGMEIMADDYCSYGERRTDG